MSESYPFAINNGSDELSLEFCGNACYLRNHTPVAIGFGNEMDHFSYFDLTADYATSREEINQIIGDKLNTDFKGSEAEFLPLLHPLFAKLSNGNYLLTLNGETKHNLTIRTEHYTDDAVLLELIFGKVIESSLVKKNEQSIPVYMSLTDSHDQFDELDYHIYSEVSPVFATKKAAEMDIKSVRYFEDRIRKNERPLILLFSAACKHKYQFSNYFLLDGHHKFKAYQNLKIVPRVAIITRLYDASDGRFLPDPLIDCLDEPHNFFVFNGAYFDENAMLWLHENPQSKVHAFIKNGWERTYFPNGQLKQETCYIFNRVEGTSRGWYESGQLEYENFHKTGGGIRLRKSYYKNGQVAEEIIINGTESSENKKRTWFESGALKMEADYHSGMGTTVLPIRTWYEIGQLETEVIGPDRKNYESKTWNKQGELIEHFIKKDGIRTWIIPQEKKSQPEDDRFLNERFMQHAVKKEQDHQRRLRAQQPPKPVKKEFVFDWQLFFLILFFLLMLVRLILAAIGL